MHLAIAIAFGIFGGLWLFVRWLEWREAWWERRELRQIARTERQAIPLSANGFGMGLMVVFFSVFGLITTMAIMR